MFYGLTPKSTRKLAYEYAKINNLQYPKTWDERKEAGQDWFSGFLRRNPNLSLRTPEPTSLARMTAFNKHTVGVFFNKLEEVIKRYNFRPNEIFNLDETGVTTVPRSEKIIGKKGCKQVGQVTSRERGELVTQVAIICSNGNALPPIWIFPRVRLDENRMMSGAPPGALGLTHPSGWMTSGNFIKVLEFFKENVRCSKEKPVLLIMDNHESHLSVEGLSFCKDNGIVILTLPPHTSNKLQPLDRSVFGPFKKFFSSAVQSLMNSNPNALLNIYSLPALCASAWDRAATPENIKSGFRAAGISPFDKDIYSELDFLPSAVSDRPMPEPQEPQSLPIEESSSPLPQTPIGGGSSKSTDLQPLPQTPLADVIAKSTDLQVITPEDIRPLPKGKIRVESNRGRKNGRCMIATDTPENLSWRRESRMQLPREEF
ncbi:uncharacterized protein LOC120355656 [Nilaparvata lugens]|uniref:uncharacterized protein LOC120355656 n=1 Tax=Nilaparvata lugens TaxID=108931 RepID=UPI00193D09C7|nr:uncharacterized protein LOC120355656 [Nilaparvata lugens]